MDPRICKPNTVHRPAPAPGHNSAPAHDSAPAPGHAAPAAGGAVLPHARPARKAHPLRNAIFFALAAVVLLFVGRSLIRSFREIDWTTFRPNLAWLLLSLAFFGVQRLLSGNILSAFLRSFGHHLSFGRACAVIWTSSMGRYVPGKMVAIGSALGMLAKFGIPVPSALAALTLSTALTILTALILCAPMFWTQQLRAVLPQGPMLAGVLIAGLLVCLHPRIFLALCNLLMGLLRRPRLPSRLNRAAFWQAMAHTVARSLVVGLALWAIVNSVCETRTADLPLILGSAMLSTVIGFLAFFVPAGLGPADGVLLLALQPRFGPFAALAVVLFRVLRTLADLLSGSAGLALIKRELAGFSPSAQPVDAAIEANEPRQLRVLFDITHPADVHLFRHVMQRLQGEGHRVLVATRDKDVTLRLLDELGIDHVCLSRMGSGLVGMGVELLQRHVKMFGLALRFRPDVMMARMGISIGPTGMILRIPRLVIEDSEHAKLQLILSVPFATKILTGFGYLKDYGARQLRFQGMPVQAYMAPEVFTPDASVLARYGVDVEKPYIVLRAVSWQAVHDRGLSGASDAELADVCGRLEQFGRVLISSERPLPPRFRQYENPVPTAHMHDLLAYAALYIGEGGTMAAEAAVLGTPSVYCNPLRTGYLLDLENRWELLYNTESLSEGVAVAERLLRQQHLRETWRIRARQLRQESDDVCEFMVRAIKSATVANLLTAAAAPVQPQQA